MPVFREFLTPGRDALLVPVNKETAMAAELEEILDDPELAAGLSSATGEKEERYYWDRCAAEHGAI